MDALRSSDGNFFQRLDSFFDALNHESGYTFVDDFRNRTAAKCDYRGSAGHGFNHDQAEWLRPVDGKQQAAALPKNSVLSCFADFADELYIGIDQKIADFGFEIAAIGVVDLSSDTQGHSDALAISMARSTRFSGDIRPRNAR